MDDAECAQRQRTELVAIILNQRESRDGFFDRDSGEKTSGQAQV